MGRPAEGRGCVVRAALLLLAAGVPGAGLAAPVLSERTMALGLVNGRVNEQQLVVIERPLPDPVLLMMRREELGELPQRLVLRQAQGWPAPQGQLEVELSWPLPGASAQGAEMRASARLVLSLLVDGRAAPLAAQQQGGDLVLLLPAGQEQLQLRSDTPLTLQVPPGFRGALSLPLEFEGWRAPGTVN